MNAQLCPTGLSLAGYRPGGLQDSDTEDTECWSDNEIAPQPPVRPREKPLGRSQSLRVVKRKPLTREVSVFEGQCEGGGWSCHAHTTQGILAFSSQGHLTFPEGPNPEKGHALRHGQLESAD